MAITDRPVWGSDVPISMPKPVSEPVMVPMFGFGMTQYRLVHQITRVQYEELAVPVYAPERPGAATVAGDAAIDAAST